MKNDVIAMVGAGNGGKAILATLLKIPDIEIRYVYDINPEAPGMILAKENDIRCRTDPAFTEIASNPEIDLILEVTGKSEVFEKLKSLLSPQSTLIGAAGTKIIFHLLDAQNKVTQKLEAYKKSLEWQIIERTEEIEKANQELQKKILDYERLNEKLLKINDEKTRYLLQATHQLKAPFAAIQSYTDIILEGYAGDVSEETRHVVEKIRIRCELLSSGIKEMLELANLKSYVRENVIMVDASLNDLVRTTIEAHSVIAEKRGIRLNFEPHSGSTLVRCNRDQLAMLFSILVDNAINYSNNNSNVDIAVSERNPNKLIVSIRDYGIGISETNLPKIFNEYFRTNDGAKKHPNGTGLGLSIAKEIVKIHDADLDVESTLGKGTTFIVTVPAPSA